jgi:hypothetical protein
MINQTTNIKSLFPPQSFKFHWVFQIGCLLFLAGLLFSGCGGGNSGNAGAGEESGTVEISVDLSSLDLQGNHKATILKHTPVTSVSATITKGAFSRPKT